MNKEMHRELLEAQRRGRTIRIPLTEILCILGIILIVAYLIIQPHFEAKAFNKFSRQKATYWDAMFGQLRIRAND